MVRAIAVLRLAAAAAILAQSVAAVRIVSGPPQTSIPRASTATSPDPAGELDLSDPRLVRKVTGFQPEGLHLQQWTSDSVLVSWQTGAELVFPTGSPPSRQPYDPKSVAAFVKYGTRSNKYSWTIRGDDSTVYSQVYDARGGNTTYYSPVLHHVRLSNLKPGQTYFYIVGNDKDGWSQEKSFNLPKPGFPVRFGFIGDLGETANSSDTLQHLAYNEPDVIVLTGDFVYADNHASNNPGNPPSTNTCSVACTYQPRWDAWQRFLEPYLSTTPLVSCKGNHEIEAQVAVAGRPAFAAANARFPYPQDADLAIRTSPMNQEDYLDATSNPAYRGFKNEATFQPVSAYYSVDYPGVAHIVSLGSYVPWGVDSAQYKWLVQDLASVDRARTPWLIVIYHVPPYHSYNTHYKEADAFQSVYESLFVTYDVDLVLHGHVHAYERTYPMAYYQRVQDGPMYITIGDAGNIEGLYKAFIDDKPARSASVQAWCDLPVNLAKPTASFQLPSYQPTPGARTPYTLQNGDFCYSKQPDWSAFRQPSFGHGILDIQSPTTARWRWHRNSEGFAVVADDVVISRSPGKGEGEDKPGKGEGKKKGKRPGL